MSRMDVLQTFKVNSELSFDQLVVEDAVIPEENVSGIGGGGICSQLGQWKRI